MKFNLTIVLTLFLLGSVLGASSASAWWAFTLGYKALKGVTQPDLSPANFLAQSKQVGEEEEEETGRKIVPEKEILIKVYDYIHARGGNIGGVRADRLRKSPNYQNVFLERISKKFPLTAADRSVTMEVVGISLESGSLVLNVTLQNQGASPVNFLYSFLDIIDDRRRAIGAITEGLPGELPANGEKYSGKVKIPKTLLYNSQTINLILTDYPQQKLKLKISKIPVLVGKINGEEG